RESAPAPIAKQRNLGQRYSQEVKSDQRPINPPRRFQANKPQDNQEEDLNQKAPNDWLAPKVYKGSSNF
ncbi:hypothetical protein KJ980_07230, partial [Patescibacteria group bacterium]|nr:hypothetical protein [Patescibacteria group bacterium]